MGKFFLSPEALEDLDAIWAYIAEDNVDAADRVWTLLLGLVKFSLTIQGLAVYG